MSKRPDTKETVLLALELLKRIPRQRKITAGELHQQLENTDLHRDLRTIQRQLDMLCEHFGIERDDRIRPYGYRWKDQERGMALAGLTPQESLLLGLAEQHLRSLLPAALMKSMDGFFQQARRNMSPGGNATLEREWLGKVRTVSTTQPLLPPKLEDGVFEAVTEALYHNQWLAIEYRNLSGHEYTAEIMPLGLAQQGYRMNLVCRYRDHEDTRYIVLHRIRKARPLMERFERPQDFDLEKYDADGHFGFGEGERIRLEFCISKEAGQHLLESKLHQDQTEVEIEDGYRISAIVVDSAMLDWWLNGFGDGVWDVRKKHDVAL